MTGHQEPKHVLHAQGGCSDCSADTELLAVGGQSWVLMVRHDDTCPTYRRRLRGRTA